MKEQSVFAVVLNDKDPGDVARFVRRVSAHCARTRLALVLEIPAINLNGAHARQQLSEALIADCRAPAVALVVVHSSLKAARSIAMDLASRGMVIGAFTGRDAATDHVLRELSLALSDSGSSPASNVSIVRLINP